MKNFALIGVAGYVAPKHLSAIRETGNTLVASLDKFDSVGVLDHYFPESHFFTEFERFDRFIEKYRRETAPIDYLSVCSPNFLHDAHVRFGLRHNASVICEKPIVLSPWNLEMLLKLQEETPGKVYSIFQLRLHPSIVALQSRLINSKARKHEVELTYVTPRGNWYHNSWKGDVSKSGGVATNIGIHFFDLLLLLFGKVQTSLVHIRDADRCAGYLELENANVKWFLSIHQKDLPGHSSISKQPFRTIVVDGESIDFSQVAVDLHLQSYRSILKGAGYGLSDALPSIELAYQIRNQAVAENKGERHPYTSEYVNQNYS